VIDVSGLTVRFSGITPIDDMSLVFPVGTCGLIGPNGAGKTTFFNLISGFFPPSEGNIVFRGSNITKLSPPERAAYVLREAFNYAYREIAAILRVEEANARQITTRARARVSGGRRAFVSPTEHRRLLKSFVAASRTGDLARLEHLFASHVVSIGAAPGSPITAPGGTGATGPPAACRASHRSRSASLMCSCSTAA